MLHRLAGLALAVLALLVPASVAAAAPVTVNLRVEGATQTLFEGPVTTDAKPTLSAPSSGGPHPCDVGQNTPTPSAVRAGISESCWEKSMMLHEDGMGAAVLASTTAERRWPASEPATTGRSAGSRKS